MKALRIVGVPYTDDEIAKAADEVKGKTELEALIAYLQVLGTARQVKEPAMDINDLRIAVTVVSLVLFVGIVVGPGAAAAATASTRPPSCPSSKRSGEPTEESSHE